MSPVLDVVNTAAETSFQARTSPLRALPLRTSPLRALSARTSPLRARADGQRPLVSIDGLVLAALSARRTFACAGAALLLYAIAFPILFC
jgi:hypothetical protein